MATKIRFLLFRDGRYYARKVVPPHLRGELGITEKRIPLGADRKTAIAQLPAALVMIDDEFQRADRRQRRSTGESQETRPAMALADLAKLHYAQRLALDGELRNYGPLYSSVSIDDGYVADLREVLSGRLLDEQIDDVLGDVLTRFQRRGELGAARGTTQWREAARMLADAELAALERVVERDDGVSPRDQEHPPHLVTPDPGPVDEAPTRFVSLKGLLEAHIAHLEKDGRGRAQRKAWPRVFDHLLKFLRAQRRTSSIKSLDNAYLLSAEELIAWRDDILGSLSPKTVKDVWLASVKAVLGHAVEDRKLPNNPARDVKVRMPKKVRLRDPGYSDEEAVKILRASRDHTPQTRANPANRESSHITAAKRWGPWLCAFTGARVGEIMQLRKSDIQMKSGRVIAKITPEAGSVKDRNFREVPLHPQILELGFMEFVAGCDDGPLFHSKLADAAKRPADTSSGRITEWLHETGLAPAGVQPNHGWRHRFKTQAIDLAINPRVYDAIQGHAGKTASDGYGTVSLKAKAEAIDRFPHYDLSAPAA